MSILSTILSTLCQLLLERSLQSWHSTIFTLSIIAYVRHIINNHDNIAIFQVILVISGNPEPRDLISSSEPPGSFPTFNHVMKSERSEDDEIDDEPSEVSSPYNY
jgi:hypothetical protein